jgi:hypothetical protein
MPARGSHRDRQVQQQQRDIRGNGAPAPMAIGKATAMVRIFYELSDALEGGASELRYLARGSRRRRPRD